MSRPKGSKNKYDSDGKIIDNPSSQLTEEKTNNEESVSIFEAAQQLETSEHAIKVWVDHGHLTSVNGRIPVRSIRECRFNARRFV